MKKIIVLVLAMMMVVSVTACSMIPGINKRSGKSTDGAEDNASSSAVDSGKEADAAVPGSSVKLTKYDFSFDDAKVYDEIEINEYYTDTPGEGNVYVVCFFTVENITDEDQFVNSLYFDCYFDDIQTDTSVVLGDVEGYSSLSGDLASGKKMKGYIVYEVPKDWKKAEITYTDGFGNKADQYIFEINADQL